MEYLLINDNYAQYAPFNSLLQMTSLIYVEKFEFENPTIMEDKQCKQTKRF